VSDTTDRELLELAGGMTRRDGSRLPGQMAKMLLAALHADPLHWFSTREIMDILNCGSTTVSRVTGQLGAQVVRQCGKHGACWRLNPNAAADLAMSARDDGGPAFAHAGSEDIQGYGVKSQSGMTLRDYFAAKAMQSWVGAALRAKDGDESPGLSDFTMDWIADYSYVMADAMLRARTTP
jgi:hypothetical protein